jgi:hypothetical protein
MIPASILAHVHEGGGQRPVTVPSADLNMRGLRRNPKIEEAPLEGELMLFDPATSKFFVMNRTMAFLWRHCDGEWPLTAIVDRLSHEFSDVDPGVAEGELRRSVEELVALGLLVPE